MTASRPSSHALAVHPHMRGDNARDFQQDTTACRFTPTCVGTIPVLADRAPYPTVHPHMRGDNHLPGYMLDGRGGSPPHAWGQSISSAWSVASVRFTPTCVGTIARPSPNIKA